MSEPIHIVGQGIAGSLLAWKCEQARIPFHVFDAGHTGSASIVGAGIINPVTGQRFVPSWRFTELLPSALAVYREIEQAVGASVVHAFRIRRIFANEREASFFRQRRDAGVLAPWLESETQDGAWFGGAWRIDFPSIIQRLRERWLRHGCLTVGTYRPSPTARAVYCTGHFLPPGAQHLDFRPSQGAMIDVESSGLDPGVIHNRGHWILPVGPALGRVGATYVNEHVTLDTAVAALQESARQILQEDVRTHGVLTGWRMTTGDRLPRAGWLDSGQRIGIANGLGSKGALFAPFLAGMWCDHLKDGRSFEDAVRLR